MSNYRSSARSVSDLKAHLVLVTKYRRKVINAAMLERLTERQFLDVGEPAPLPTTGGTPARGWLANRTALLVHHFCSKWGCEMVEFNGESDHCHLIFQYYPQMQLSKFVNGLKTYTSMMIRQEFPAQVKRFYARET